MRGFTFAHVVRVLRQLGPAVGIYIGAIYELVIDREDVLILISEKHHAVAVIAEGAFLAGAGSTTGGIEDAASDRSGSPQRATICQL